jgi:hypothetical protein
MNMETENGYSYFNGTACPIVFTKFVDYKKTANEILVDALNNGLCINDLRKIHLEQMVDMEKCLSEICGVHSANTDYITRWCETMGMEEEQANFIWYTNVYILLKLKVIENDNMNGMLYRRYVVINEDKK